MNIPFLDLKKINQRFHIDFTNVYASFLNSGNYILGNKVSVFEKEFADYCGVNYCIGVGNGLDALFLILKAYIELGKLNKGDEILVAANTYIATILAIKNAGLQPVLVEPSNITHNINPLTLDSFINIKTKGVLVTHLFGQLADMDSLRKFSQTNNLLLISDSAQAHGATNSNNAKAGSLANASGFSFYPSKNLGALGDGGAVTTNDNDLATCIRKLRNYGASSKYVNDYIGVNSRLDEFQAGILSIKLRKLDIDNSNRRAIAKRYIKEINNKSIGLPDWDFTNNHVFHLFVITVKNRAHFQSYMKKNEIETLIHYPIPAYKQKAFKGDFLNSYPITDKLCEQVVSLPISPVMAYEEVSYVIQVINLFGQ